jgi:hypothetical protein
MKILMSFFLIFQASIITAQIYKVQKSWAFITEAMPGTVMANENRTPITPQPIVNRFIYLETNYKGTLKVDTVILNDFSYKASVAVAAAGRHKAGVIYTNGKPFYIMPKKGNKLWRVDLQAINTNMPGYGKLKKLIVSGKLGTVAFIQSFTQEVQLTGPEYN